MLLTLLVTKEKMSKIQSYIFKNGVNPKKIYNKINKKIENNYNDKITRGLIPPKNFEKEAKR